MVKKNKINLYLFLKILIYFIINHMKLEERCYVIYGTNFKPLKIKGFSNKNKLIESLESKGLKPKYSLLNCNSPNGKKCKTTPTLY